MNDGPDPTFVASDGAAKASPPSGLQSGVERRRTISAFETAPRDGTPFHILNTLRFNPFAQRFEGLVHAEDGKHVWRPVAFSGHEPTMWLRFLPLPYELPNSFAFTLTYEVRRKTWRDRLVERLFRSLSGTLCMASAMHRWTALAAGARSDETPTAAQSEGRQSGAESATPKRSLNT